MRASFPPVSHLDIASYDGDEMLQGFLEWTPDDIEPGPNHSPAYRWGWTNRQRDAGKTDGFDRIRHDYIRANRKAA